VADREIRRIEAGLEEIAQHIIGSGIGRRPQQAINAQEELLTDALDSSGELKGQARELVSKANGREANTEH
jgi:hypothetical protein